MAWAASPRRTTWPPICQGLRVDGTELALGVSREFLDEMRHELQRVRELAAEIEL